MVGYDGTCEVCRIVYNLAMTKAIRNRLVVAPSGRLKGGLVISWRFEADYVILLSSPRTRSKPLASTRGACLLICLCYMPLYLRRVLEVKAKSSGKDSRVGIRS